MRGKPLHNWPNQNRRPAGDCDHEAASRTRGTALADRSAGSPHGQYVQLLVETGLLGALTFLWFLFELFKLLRYFLKNQKDFRVNIVASAISAILISRLAAGILGDYIIPQYHNGGLQSFCSTIYFWIGVGILIGLKRVLLFEQQQKGLSNDMAHPA